MKPAGKTWRRIRASWRDTVLLFREFRLPLFLFALVMIGSGGLYYQLSAGIENQARSFIHGVYISITMAFLQPIVDFPTQPHLQVFFFIMPVIGISLLAQGLTEFGVMLFNRQARGKDWEMAVASTFNNHVVLVGLGHLGYRVVKQLTDLEQDIVVIERSPDPDLLNNVRNMGVPVIEDDGSRETALIGAGVSHARAIILCTQNDITNLRMALKARSLNPKIEVIMRIFDDEFAASLQSQFGFQAMSATGMAAPLFAATAAKINITPPINIEGLPHILANIQIHPGSRLCSESVISLEEKYRVSIVLLCKDGSRTFHPPGSLRIRENDTLAVFGEPVNIHKLLHENRH